MQLYGTLLSKRGALGKIWLAGHHWDKSVTKKDIERTDISGSVSDIVQPGKSTQDKLALRVASQLLLGIVRIYQKKLKYLQDDASEALARVKLSFRGGAAATLTVAQSDKEHAGQKRAREKAITLQEGTGIDLDLDLDIPLTLELDVDMPIDLSIPLSQEQSAEKRAYEESASQLEAASQRVELMMELDENAAFDPELDLQLSLDNLEIELPRDGEDADMSVELPRRHDGSELGLQFEQLNDHMMVDDNMLNDNMVNDLPGGEELAEQSFNTNAEGQQMDDLSISVAEVSLPDVDVRNQSANLASRVQIKKRVRKNRLETVDKSIQIDENLHYQDSSEREGQPRPILPLTKKARLMVEFSKPSSLMEFLKNPQAVSISLAQPLSGLYSEAAANIFSRNDRTEGDFETEIPRAEFDLDSQFDVNQSLDGRNSIQGSVGQHDELEQIPVNDFESQGLGGASFIDDFPDSIEMPEIPHIDVNLRRQSELEPEGRIIHAPASDQAINLVLEGESGETEGKSDESADAESGWSDRTKKAYELFSQVINEQQQQEEESRESIVLQDIVRGKSKRAAAVLFHELLVLKSRDAVQVEQSNPFQSIYVTLRSTTL
jgi:cohesin complex subunit SCC1